MLDLGANVDADLTVGEAADEYLDDCRIRNLSQGTIRWYDSRLRSMLQSVWDCDLSGVTAQQLKAIIGGMIGDRAASTVNGYVRTLKAFLHLEMDDAPGTQGGDDLRVQLALCLSEGRGTPCLTGDRAPVPGRRVPWRLYRS
jgi:hypothetical protein